MAQYRLNYDTVAIQEFDGGAKMAITMPAGSEISSEANFPRSRIAPYTMIRVAWNGAMVQMFLLDLVNRGERI